MNSRQKRIFQFKKTINKKYQIELENLQNQVNQNNYFPGQNHNYNYYLSLLINLQKNEKKWKLKHYRKYLAAYRIQLFWRKIFSKKLNLK